MKKEKEKEERIRSKQTTNKQINESQKTNYLLNRESNTVVSLTEMLSYLKIEIFLPFFILLMSRLCDK